MIQSLLGLFMVMNVTSAGATNSAIDACKQKHAQFSKICKKTNDVTKAQGVPASLSMYTYEDCGSRDFVTVTLTKSTAGENTPAFTGCTVTEDKFKAGLSKKEVISSLGTKLVVEIDENNLTTQVHTSEGHISCKADPKEANPINWWCGVMILPDTKYTEVTVVDNYQLSPLYFRKKSLKDFLQKTSAADDTSPAKAPLQ